MSTDWQKGAYQPTLFEDSDLATRQAAVWRVLDVIGPCTDEELVRQYPVHWPHFPQSPSGLRSRRAELVHLGLVEWTGRKVRMATWGLARTWRVTPTSPPPAGPDYPLDP